MYSPNRLLYTSNLLTGSDDPAPTAAIRQVYNQTVTAYNVDRAKLRTQKYLTKFLDHLSPQSHILDLGCGSGTPIDDVILKKGHLLTGLDFAEQQLVQARKHCPTGQFILRDLTTLQPNEFTTDGIICLYTLFHLPRHTHAAWLKTIASYLATDAPLLISMGDKNFEGWHEFHGQQIWSSHFGPATNRQMLIEAGFELEIDEIDRSNFEAHQIVLAIKR